MLSLATNHPFYDFTKLQTKFTKIFIKKKTIFQILEKKKCLEMLRLKISYSLFPTEFP